MSWDIRPVYKMVDTCAAEFDAVTPYFYSTYEEENEASPQPGQEGARHRLRARSASARASSSTTARCTPPGRCRRPATRRSSPTPTRRPSPPTSTPRDRLYFEPLDEESVRDILENEDGDGAEGGGELPAAIVQFGGQTAINLAEPLLPHARARSSAQRTRRSTWRRTAAASRSFLSGIGIPQPPGAGVLHRRRGAGDGAEDRLPGAGAPQLRARRARDGDRPERDRAAALPRQQAVELAEGKPSSSTSTSKAKRSRSTRSATATTC